MRVLSLVLLLIWPWSLSAGPNGGIVRDVVEQHILPGFERLAKTAEDLEDVAGEHCAPQSETLKAAYHMAFDAWLGVSHLRFGPTEVDDRAFALAFWPDTKGFTPKALAGMILSEDPAARDPARFTETSIAGRGLYALEFLLFDDRISTLGSDDYRCTLVRAIAKDIRQSAAQILEDWQTRYANLLLNPGEESPYRTEDEALQEVFKALATGLQFTSDTRLGRPLGSFEKPRPKRAEARRSGRSLANVVLTMRALEDLAGLLSTDHPALALAFTTQFAFVYEVAEELEDPVFAGVASVQGRFRVEIIQQYIDHIRETVALELGPALGVTAGFNALDGD